MISKLPAGLLDKAFGFLSDRKDRNTCRTVRQAWHHASSEDFNIALSNKDLRIWKKFLCLLLKSKALLYPKAPLVVMDVPSP